MQNQPKFTATFYTPPSLTSPQRLMFRDFYDVDDKISYLKNNKDEIEKKYDINVINLINAYMNDNWPQRKGKNFAN